MDVGGDCGSDAEIAQARRGSSCRYGIASGTIGAIRLLMPLPLGKRLGPYEILAPLGAGGMGEVYRARDTRLDRTVAVKISDEQVSWLMRVSKALIVR